MLSFYVLKRCSLNFNLKIQEAEGESIAEIVTHSLAQVKYQK